MVSSSVRRSRELARTVALQAMVTPYLVEHLAEYVDSGPDARVFTGPKGAPIRRGNFNTLVGWGNKAAELGVPGLHFHDLRHTGTPSRLELARAPRI